jgi:hypothetical protein
MTPSEFESRLRELMRAQAVSVENAHSIECHGCEKCLLCTFCLDSKSLTRCHYCTASSNCTDCAHCRGCTSCLGCSHCIASERCTGSNYLVKCVGLSDCSYCFGCAGLSHKDFHILNEPYDRKEYFAITSKLAGSLRL